jgi:hypothetical protein
MDKKTELNKRLSAKIEIDYPDFSKLPDPVRQKFESLPTKVNFFRMMGYSPGTFVPIIDLTNAIFKGLTLSDYHKGGTLYVSTAVPIKSGGKETNNSYLTWKRAKPIS